MSRKAYKPCFTISDLPFVIELAQLAPDDFRVTYGVQVEEGLNYADAAAKLGECVMHALACDDRLDNSEEGER